MRLAGPVIWRYVVSAACLMGHHPMRGHEQSNREIAQSSRHRSSAYMSNPKAKRNWVIMVRVYPAMWWSLSGSVVPRTTRVREVRGAFVRFEVRGICFTGLITPAFVWGISS